MLVITEGGYILPFLLTVAGNTSGRSTACQGQGRSGSHGTRPRASLRDMWWLSSYWQGSCCSSSLPSSPPLSQSSPGSPKLCLPTAFQQLSNSVPSPRCNLACSSNRSREEQKSLRTAVSESWQAELRTAAADGWAEELYWWAGLHCCSTKVRAVLFTGLVTFSKLLLDCSWMVRYIKVQAKDNWFGSLLRQTVLIVFF